MMNSGSRDQCHECCEPRRNCACGVCVPLILKVYFEADYPEDDYFCCIKQETTLAWDCSVELGAVSGDPDEFDTAPRYVGGAINCGAAQWTITGTVVLNDNDECVLRIFLTEDTDEAEVTTLESPTFSLTASAGGGTITIEPLEGYPNPKIYKKKFEEEDCPDCPPIPMEKIVNNVRITEQRVPNTGAGGPQLQSRIPEPLIHAEPCRCVPKDLCLTYTSGSPCGGDQERVNMSCSGGGWTATFDILTDGGTESRTVTITPDDESCSYTISVSGASVDFSSTISIHGRWDHASLDTWERWTKLCDLTVDNLEVRYEDNGGFPISEYIDIDYRHYCEVTSVECNGGCAELDFTAGDEPCEDTPMLNAEVTAPGCDWDGLTFEMCWYDDTESYNECTQLAGLSVIDENSPPSGCHQFLSYSSDYETFPSEITPDKATVYFEGCDYGGNPAFDNYTWGEFFLEYDPLDCEPQTTLPQRYRLHYYFTSSCNGTTEDQSGIAEPTSASCDPFELTFEIPYSIPDPCDCCENSSGTFTITITE